MANVALPNPATSQDILNALVAAVQETPLAPPVVTATPLAAASTNYTYVVVAKVNGDVIPGSVTIATGAATLSAAASNSINWNTIPGAVYDVYRTAGGSNQGKIASNLPGVTYNSYGGVQATLQSVTLVDNGLPGDASTAPPFNTSGVLASAVQETVQVLSANGAISIATGIVIITKGSLAAVTLAQPIAGSAQAGGHDGCQLTITTTTAYAHTITTAANGINGTVHVGTLGSTTPAAGTSITFTAYNGVWYATSLNGSAVA